MGKNTFIGVFAGLLIGLIVGFSTANYLNRSEPKGPETQIPVPSAASSGPDKSPGADQSAKMKDVQATLEKAR
ncbi:MAG: hypothetical protein OEQ28_15365, partial [Acidobacteriota bacterium]|nr:hypothetical protein [Acidobacteriota bacterium]